MSQHHTPPHADARIPFGPEQRPWIETLPEIALGPDGVPLVRPPSADPKVTYQRRSQDFPFQESLLPEELLQLSATGLTAIQRSQSLAHVKQYLEGQRSRFLGYQVVEQMRGNDELAELLNLCINNIGDPFTDGNFTVNTKTAERAVLDFFASLWHAQWPSTGNLDIASGTQQEAMKSSPYWGYVLTMGSTEGNLYAILNARDYLSGTRLFDEDGESSLFTPFPPEDNPNAYTPVAFFSEDTHYSVNKAVHAMGVAGFAELGAERYPGECPLDVDWVDLSAVPSQPGCAEYPVGNGSIDIDKLEVLVSFFASRGFPILLILNYGTTFKGAYDDVQEVGERLMPVFCRYGLDRREVRYGPNPQDVDWRTGYWIHVDGALGASFMPFVNLAKQHDKTPESGPVFDFRLPFVHSMVTSGHKWLGASMPTGIYMTRQQYLVSPPDHPEYLGSPDTTFAGSRNGLSAMVLWQQLAKAGYSVLVKRALDSLRLADLAYQRLAALSDEIELDIWLQRSPLSLSIIFRKPIDKILFKYSLCTANDIYIDENKRRYHRTYVHMFIFWDRDLKTIESLIDDLRQPGAFDNEVQTPIDSSKALQQSPHGVIRRRIKRTGGLS